METINELAPLRKYSAFSLCRAVAVNLLEVCPYCNINKTQHTPLGDDLWICCLTCYEDFRIGYLKYLGVKEDTSQERGKYIYIFKKERELVQ